MCQIYTNTNPMCYASRNRSVRISKVVTSIRLENIFWDILAQIAASEQVTMNQLIAKLYEELYALYGEIPNFTSFLRVTCMNYMASRATKPLTTFFNDDHHYEQYSYK